jgi:hypothetical protein
MNRQVVIAREADEIMLVSFVIAHKDVFAMDTAIIVPPAFCLFYGLAFGVIVRRERYLVPQQVTKNTLLPFRYYFIICDVHNSEVLQISCKGTTNI